MSPQGSHAHHESHGLNNSLLAADCNELREGTVLGGDIEQWEGTCTVLGEDIEQWEGLLSLGRILSSGRVLS